MSILSYFFNYVVGHNLTQTTQVSKPGSHVSEKDKMSNGKNLQWKKKIWLLITKLHCSGFLLQQAGAELSQAQLNLDKIMLC